MAADTEAPAPPVAAAAPPATPAPPVPGPNGAAVPNQAPTSQADVRRILGRGMRARAAQAAALFPRATPSENPSALAVPPGNGVVSEQQAGATPTVPAAPSESPPHEATPAPPEREALPPAPGTPAAAPPERAETPPQAQAAPPASSGQPTPPTPPAQPARPDLPPEYATAEYQDRFAADPLLRREVLGIWRQPDTSDIAKAHAIAKRVDASDKRIGAARDSQNRLRQLRQSGNLQEWAKQVDLQEAQEAYRQQWAQGVTQLLARTLGTDPNDEGFANAGAIAPGESEELRAIRFAEWAVQHSPVGRTHLAGVTDVLRAEHETALAQLRQAHEEELKSLRGRLEQEAAAQAAAALAQGRGTQTAFPPRAPGAAVNGTEAGVTALPTTVRDVRGLLSAGLRLRQESARTGGAPPG